LRIEADDVGFPNIMLRDANKDSALEKLRGTLCMVM